MSVQIGTGTYAGDGTPGQTIPTGLSGNLLAIEIDGANPGPPPTFQPWYVKTDQMPGGQFGVYAGVFPALDDAVTIVGADFVVAGAGANAPGFNYAWRAWSE